MGTIDQELSNYVWDNLSELESIFSEKVYRVLLRFIEKEDREGFSDTLEVILDSDEELLETIAKKIISQFEDIENLSLEDVTMLLKMSSYSNSKTKEYMKRAEYWVKNNEIEDENYALLLNTLAELYHRRGMYKEAKSRYCKALKIHKKLLGEKHPDTATSYNNLGELYTSLRKYKKAESFFLKSLKIRKNIFGEEHLETARVYTHLAKIYSIMEVYEEAEPLFQKALKIIPKILGEKHKETISLIYAINIVIYERNLSFKINQIKIENFKQFNTPFSMQFSKQINIIIGENAIGKTTLLQAITLGLLEENSPDEETNYRKYITKGEKESEIEITYQNEKKRKVTILKNRRKIKETYNRPFVLAYGSNFFANYRDSEQIVQEMLNEEMASDFADTIFLESTSTFCNPLSVLRNLATSSHKKAEDKKETMLDKLNIFLEVEGYAIVPNNEDNTRFYFIKKSDKSQLILSQLSEGYRGNVLLITDMLIKILGTGREPSTVNAVVLIDEFDRHLHPKWQSKLVDKLTDVFENIQFIMTTHNPMSILDRNADEVTILKEVDGEIKAVKKRVGTKKIGVSTVLLEYFGVDSTVSETMKSKIDEFTKLKLKDALTVEEEKKITELEEFLDETVATNFIYNRAYFNFLKFLKKNKNIDFEKYEKISNEEMEELLVEYKDLFE